MYMKRLQNRRTRTTETTVPEIESKTNKVRVRGGWIEITKTITSSERNSFMKVKYREPKWIKGNINIIVSSELSYKNQIFNNLWCVTRPLNWNTLSTSN